MQSTTGRYVIPMAFKYTNDSSQTERVESGTIESHDSGERTFATLMEAPGQPRVDQGPHQRPCQIV